MALRVLAAQLAFIVLVFGGAASLADDYPSRPIRVIVPFAAGGTGDIVARVTSDQMATQLKQPMIIENRGGANGIIGTDAVAKAAPDGYTLLTVTASVVVNPSVRKKLPFDPMRDLAPVSEIGRGTGYLLIVNPSLPVKSVRELVAATKAPNATWNYSSPGVGNTLHLATELFKAKTGAQITHVVYRSAGLAITAVVSNEVQATFVPPLPVLDHVRSGTVRALAFTGTTRLPELPDVPTLSEATGTDFVMNGGWHGLFVPAATPRPIIERLQNEMRKALATPRVAEALRKGGYEPVGSTPDEFAQFVKAEFARYAEVVKAAKIEPE